MKFHLQQTNKKFEISRQKGFTLIETMIAILILTATLSGFFTIVSGGLFSARYSNNEITANYLIQEALDAIRNDRDTIAFQNADPNDRTVGWTNFKDKYSSCFGRSTTDSGCYFEPADTSSLPQKCDTDPGTNFGQTKCPTFNYDDKAQGYGFYTYHTVADMKPANFKRRVLIFDNSQKSDEVDILVTVEWLNGNVVRSHDMVVSLLNWRP